MRTFIKNYKFEIISFFIAVSLGTINHFLFNWLNKPPFLAPFLPINESVFEHYKLLFYPLLFLSVIEGIILKKSLPTLISSRTISVIISIVLLTLFHYFIMWLSDGNKIAFLDISSYYIFMALSYFMSDLLYNKYLSNKQFITLGLTLLFVFISLLTMFTWYKPNFTLFIE